MRNLQEIRRTQLLTFCMQKRDKLTECYTENGDVVWCKTTDGLENKRETCERDHQRKFDSLQFVLSYRRWHKVFMPEMTVDKKAHMLHSCQQRALIMFAQTHQRSIKILTDAEGVEMNKHTGLKLCFESHNTGLAEQICL